MDKFGTRYYDPSATRWTQLDPRAGTLSQPMSQNGYLYVNDDCTNHVDPSGEQAGYPTYYQAEAIDYGATVLLACTPTILGAGVSYAGCVVVGTVGFGVEYVAESNIESLYSSLTSIL
jgi:hypothetical protein